MRSNIPPNAKAWLWFQLPLRFSRGNFVFPRDLQFKSSSPKHTLHVWEALSGSSRAAVTAAERLVAALILCFPPQPPLDPPSRPLPLPRWVPRSAVGTALGCPPAPVICAFVQTLFAQLFLVCDNLCLRLHLFCFVLLFAGQITYLVKVCWCTKSYKSQVYNRVSHTFKGCTPFIVVIKYWLYSLYCTTYPCILFYT